MDPATVFRIANAAVLPGWALLAVAPRWRLGTDVIAPLVIPGALAVVYLGYVAVGLSSGGDDGGGFGSLQGVMTLFRSEQGVLAGWIHYLCFDLFIGAWEVRDARRLGLHHGLVLPCLLFTFLLGPIGLLAYLLLRATVGGRRTVDELSASA